MKVILQRVLESSVKVNGASVGEIGRGLMLLVGFGEADTRENLKPMVAKILNMRIFPDEKGRFHLSLIDIEGDLLLVPQFTLFADTSKGRRPEFFGAMAPDRAVALFDELTALFRETAPARVATGEFGADMKVALINDGPVTILVEN